MTLNDVTVELWENRNPEMLQKLKHLHTNSWNEFVPVSYDFCGFNINAST